MTAHVTIDIGGTFTDCLVQDEHGRVAAFKAPTTPDDPTRGLLDALDKAAASRGQSLTDFVAEIESIVHGTTLATNALLTGTGAKVGMLTTRGFRDQIEARRGQKNIRTSMYNLFVPPYRPLVPRSRRLPVTERLTKDGTVATALDEAGVRRAIDRLAEDGVESIAVCLLHAYANGTHERRVAELCRERLEGDVFLTTSHEVLPVWGEYERFSTTVVGAYIGPLVAGYLRGLEERLGRLGFEGSLFIVQSDGLMQSARTSSKRTIGLVNSGPAAAPISALSWGQANGVHDLISMDMGGTSFDVCLLEGGVIPTTSEGWVGDERISIKMVDTLTVGAGGGSIVWIDDFGLLRVGPRSAGANPGPACYGWGGVEPTVTDTDVILGYVPADFFLGGEIALDARRAHDALVPVSRALNVEVAGAAQAVFASVNSFMADQITEISTKRGLDVREFTLVSGGGAGPVHAAHIAELLGIRTVVVPRYSALYSAFGMFSMDVGREYVRSYIAPAEQVDLDHLAELYRSMEADALADLAENHVDPNLVEFTRVADMRYAGQYHAVEVPLRELPTTASDVRAIAAAFEARHQELYTFNLPFRTAEFMLFRLKASVPRPAPRSVALEAGSSDASGAIKRSRSAFMGGDWLDVTCYDADLLRAGNTLLGPALIEERRTTVVVPAGFLCTVDESRAFVLQRSAR